MGKETGFLEYERKDRGYADPKARVRHYKEFTLPHAEPDLRLQAARRDDVALALLVRRGAKTLFIGWGAGLGAVTLH